MVGAIEREARTGEAPAQRLALVSGDEQLKRWVPQGWEAMPLAIEDGAASMEQRLSLADVVVVDARRTVSVWLVRLLAERQLPVVVLMERDATGVRELGYLEAGADAVISARASTRFTAARLDALVRSAGRRGAADGTWVAGDLQISVERREVLRAGARVRLTRTEFDVLALLARRGGLAVSARALATQVWGGDSESAAHSVRVYVHRLREKLEDTPGEPVLLVTEQDGYRLSGVRSAVQRADRRTRVGIVGGAGMRGLARLRTQLERDGLRCVDRDVSNLDACAVDAVLAPPGDALRFLQRATGLDGVPVVALLPAWSEDEAARALEQRADDVVAIGAGADAVRAHLDAVVRRAAREPVAGRAVVRTGELVVDRASGRVTLRGAEVGLTPREFEVLDVLAASVGRVVAHDELLRRVWGAGHRTEAHLVRMYVAYLRSKLEAEAGTPRYIDNEWGCGYRLALLPTRDRSSETGGGAEARTSSRCDGLPGARPSPTPAAPSRLAPAGR